jgi:hypothetical protein
MYDPIAGLSKEAKAAIFDQIYSLIRSTIKIGGTLIAAHGVEIQSLAVSAIGTLAVAIGLAASVAAHK